MRALSSAYVERRESALADHKALDGAGKRAAFAMYYGPIHFLLVQHIVRELGVDARAAASSSTSGAARASPARRSRRPATPPLRVIGIDTHPWTLDEARFTYKAFGLQSDVRRGHAARTRFPADTSFVVAAFVVNELKDGGSRGAAAADPDPPAKAGRIGTNTHPDRRADLAIAFRRGGRSGSRSAWAAAPMNGRPASMLPPLVKRLAKAAGLRPEVLTARSLFV